MIAINKALIEIPGKHFTRHLQLEGNDRIIFSGKYGSGKSTFLKEFFKDETQEKLFSTERYEVVRIYPVNYSVSSNEDIFRLIKYDLILELISKREYDFLKPNQFPNKYLGSFYLHNKINGLGILIREAAKLNKVTSIAGKISHLLIKLEEIINGKNYKKFTKSITSNKEITT